MPKRNLFVLLIAVAVAGASLVARWHAGDGHRVAEVLETISRSYLDPVDRKSLFDAAMDGVFSRLDEHSAFVAGDRRAEIETALDQEFGGVGLELEEADAAKGLVVVSPVVDSPAWHAGIAAGDRVLAIDGAPVTRVAGAAIVEASRRLRGPAGTAVTVSIARGESAREVSLVRQVVRTESVLGDRRRPDGSWDWEIEGEPGCWIIRIASFGERTADESRRALQTIAARAAADAEGRPVAPGRLVIDVRGNQGGLLSAAVDVCDLFLDDGEIVSTRGRSRRAPGAAAGSDDAPVDVRRAKEGVGFPPVPMAVLVDGLTASAAEVVAACLQDHGRAVVVGSRSFGKGTVQSIVPLSDGSGLVKLTTAEYLRPSRANIHRRGGAAPGDTWGVSPDPGLEIVPTGRQIEALERWRRSRDVVPAKGAVVADAPVPSHASLPRQVDPVLAAALDALESRR